MRRLKRFALELGDAARNVRTIGWEQQLGAWGHGFYSRQAVLFDFDRFGYADYLSEFQRRFALPAANRHSYLLGDKLLAFLFLREIGTPTSAVYGFGDRHSLVFLDELGTRDGLEALLRREGTLAAKPRNGSGGAGFRLLTLGRTGIEANGREIEDVRKEFRPNFIISQFMRQHSYAATIFPDSTNTLRVITAKDIETGEPFVAGALHRFGTSRSKPVDNTDAGGFTSGVDVATGELGPLAGLPGYNGPRSGPVLWYDRHPDTGAPVVGTYVPRWQDIVDELSRTMAKCVGLHWVGWDVVVTPDGFAVIEGNGRPDVILQVHGPLLSGERGRRFISQVRTPWRRGGP